MNKDNIKLWVEALRDGYNQARKTLHDEVTNSFCAVGVLCETYRKETGIGHWEGVYFVSPEEKSVSFPSTDVLRWILDNRTFDDEEMIWDIVAQNDTYKLNFSQIADYIEENWLGTNSTIEEHS